MITNALLIFAVLLTLFDPLWMLFTGKFLYGVASGAFTVYCPKFLAETAPVEVKGPTGGLTQLSITFGILVAFTVGLGIGDPDTDDVDSFAI